MKRKSDLKKILSGMMFGVAVTAFTALFSCKVAADGGVGADGHAAGSVAKIGYLALKNGTMIAPEDVDPSMKDDASGIVIYDQDGEKIVVSTQSFPKMTFANKSEGAILNSSKIKSLPDYDKPLLKIPGNDAIGNGGYPKVDQDWWSLIIDPVLRRNGVDDLDDPNKYPILKKLKDFNEQNGGGWFIPGVVACTYISEYKDKINEILDKLELDPLPGGTMTSVIYTGGDFFFYPFSVTDYPTLITTRETGAIAVGMFNPHGNFAVIDGDTKWYAKTYECILIKVLK